MKIEPGQYMVEVAIVYDATVLRAPNAMMGYSVPSHYLQPLPPAQTAAEKAFMEASWDLAEDGLWAALDGLAVAAFRRTHAALIAERAPPKPTPEQAAVEAFRIHQGAGHELAERLAVSRAAYAQAGGV